MTYTRAGIPARDEQNDVMKPNNRSQEWLLWFYSLICGNFRHKISLLPDYFQCLLFCFHANDGFISIFTGSCCYGIRRSVLRRNGWCAAA